MPKTTQRYMWIIGGLSREQRVQLHTKILANIIILISRLYKEI